jgi:demethylspheroidene O-methyltransferase
MLGAAIVADPAIAAMIEHHADFYADLADPVSLLAEGPTNTRLSRFWPYASRDNLPEAESDPTAPYSALMASSQVMLADDILDAYDFSGHKRVLDVGGGEGVFLTALLRRNPAVQGHLFDLPPVAARAAIRLQSAGFGSRAAATGGDFFRDPLPGQPDIVTLVRIAHDHDDDRLAGLFANSRRGLPPGGLLVIAEPMSGTRDAARVADVYFAFYLLAMGSGRPRTPAALERLLSSAGFGRFHRVETARPMLVSLLVAHRL